MWPGDQPSRMSTPTDADGAERPADGCLREHVDDRLFGSSMDSLDRFADRLGAVAEPHRFALLYHVHERVGGDLETRVPREELRRASELGDDDGGFANHVKELLAADLLTEATPPAGADGRKTFYRLTYAGRELVEALERYHRGPEA